MKKIEQEYEGVVSLKPKRKRRMFSRLFSVTRKVPLADNRFFVQMEICVPHPTLDSPMPAIFIFQQCSSGRLWFSLKSVVDLKKLFSLNIQDEEALTDALAQAERIAETYKAARHDIEAITDAKG